MSSFLEFIEEPVEVPVTEVVGIVPAQPAAITREEEINAQLRELENELFATSLEQIQAAQAWPDVATELDPKDENEIPEELVEKHGKQKAKRMYRIARAAMLPSKDAPVGLKQNVQLATGIIKARAHEKTGPKILNINLVEMPQVTVQFPETEVKERK